MALVLLRYRYHEAKVRVDHQILCLLVAALDEFRELHLFGGREQLVAARLVQEELQRVGRDDCQVAVDVRALGRLRPGAIVREGNPPLLELLEEPGRLVLVEVGLLEELAYGREVETAELLALFEQCLDAVVDRHCAAYSPFRALA